MYCVVLPARIDLISEIHLLDPFIMHGDLARSFLPEKYPLLATRFPLNLGVVALYRNQSRHHGCDFDFA